jgi:hypothetical protein
MARRSRSKCGDEKTRTFRLLDRPCATCVIFPDDRAYLGQERRTSFIEEVLAKDSYVVCHETGTGKTEPAICRGFFNAHRHDSWRLRLIVFLGLVREVPAPAPGLGRGHVG